MVAAAHGSHGNDVRDSPNTSPDHTSDITNESPITNLQIINP
jgi:hypothetical protein